MLEIRRCLAKGRPPKTLRLRVCPWCKVEPKLLKPPRYMGHGALTKRIDMHKAGWDCGWFIACRNPKCSIRPSTGTSENWREVVRWWGEKKS